MEKLFFNRCIVEAWPDTGYTKTLFDDGSIACALPKNTSAYLHMMHEVGYTKPNLMCVHHEILHSFLAEAINLDYSPVLWASAHKDEYNPNEDVYLYEEACILSFQKYLRGLGKDPILEEFQDRHRLNIHVLKKDALRLLDFTLE